MGSRGPGKTPTTLKLIHGERRESRLNRNAPKPRANLPRLPSDMAPAAKVIWRRILRDFGHTGVLTAVDTDNFRSYCEAVVRYNQAATLLTEAGPLIRGRDGNLVKNPAHQIARDNAVLMRALGRDLGFLPSARESLTMAGETGDELGSWLAGNGTED